VVGNPSSRGQEEAVSARAYELQSTHLFRGDDLVRVSDGEILCSDICMPSEALDELNRLASENEKLRESRDAVTTELKREIESLRAQVAAKTAESRGQSSFNWPAIQY
jgi:hypothetical protein